MDQSADEPLDPMSLLLRALQAALRPADAEPRHAPETEAARLMRLWLGAIGGPWSALAGASPLTDWWARVLRAPETAGDPLSFWLRWYGAHSQALSDALDAFLRSPAFVEASARALDDYATAAAAQRRAGELAARVLPFATHADITRVARMIVALEAKLEPLLDQSQSLAGQRNEERSGAEVVALTARLERLEAKVDRLLARLANDAPSRPEGQRRAPGGGATRRAAEAPPGGRTSRRRMPALETQQQVRPLGDATAH